MNKLIFLTLLLLISPFAVFADETETEVEDEPGIQCVPDVYTSETYNSSFNAEDLNTYYCADLITYPISEETAMVAMSKHSAAKAGYTSIVNKWRVNKAAGASSSENPTNDCLGIARFVMCAHQFRKCDVEYGEKLPVCSFLCTLLKRRCPDETSYYEEICSDTTDENCSSAGRIGVGLVSIITFLIYAILF